MEKRCDTCGHPLTRRARDSAAQWEARTFCSIKCANAFKKAMPIHLYFWKYTERRGDDDCWPWIGVCDQLGYGRAHHMNATYKAHRVSYEMRNGRIPDGMVVRHSCDNPNCVNPSHLSVGTQSDNMKDASARGRLNKKSLLNLRPGKKGFYGAPSATHEGNDGFGE